MFKSKGYFKTIIRATSNSPGVNANVHVVDRPGKMCPLLSRTTSLALGLISINIPKQINHVSHSFDVNNLINGYEDLFRGIGCHKDCILSLPMDPNVKPVACPPSRVPVHLLPAIQTELERLEGEGVIESVPVDDVNQWISRMVPVPRKIEGSDKPGIRITLDWRNVNKGLKKVHHESPNLESLCYDVNGAKCFSHLDMASAFSQYRIDDESKKITTFRTPWGLKRHTRLIQGALPSSAIFHEALRRDLEGLKNVLNVHDNIIVWGTGANYEDARKGHNESLRALFERLREKELTLNKSKCVFEAKKISFFGLIFSEDGISPDPEKVKALHEATPPQTKTEVRSFLGMAGWNQKFIPQYATITEPLRRLTTKEAVFEWTQEQQSAFDAIKRALEETTLLSFFDPKKKSACITDASPFGIHATLAQYDENGDLRPVSFASRALSTTEQKYDQIEREAVAMQFGCQRFKLFLLGAPFDHLIDPETLKPMIENPRKEAPARIEKLRLKMQGFDQNIVLIKGNKNPADFLSRHPLPYSTTTKEEKMNAADIENHIFFLTQLLPEAITTDRIRDAINNDLTLLKIKDLIRHNRHPSTFSKQLKHELAPFVNVWDEISVANNLLLRGQRFILPKSLIPDAIKISHTGHQGISKSKQYLRASIWFPDMDRLVEDNVKACIPCQAATPLTQAQPLQMSDLPPEPWQILAADLFGPLPTGERIFVLKCLRTKWPEIKIILRGQSTDAVSIIGAMEQIFSTHGIPDQIMTDNGPPFNSIKFANFAKQSGFHHRKITPLHPQANGQIENFMRNLGKVIRTARTQKVDWKQALNDYLMVYRATPHPATDASPASLLFPGRRYKTHLPPTTAKISPAQVDQKFQDSQNRAKTYADARRNAKDTFFSIGDSVLVKQTKKNKFSTPFCPRPLFVSQIKGSMVTAKSGEYSITRDKSFFKQIPPQHPQTLNETKPVPAQGTNLSSELSSRSKRGFFPPDQNKNHIETQEEIPLRHNPAPEPPAAEPQKNLESLNAKHQDPVIPSPPKRAVRPSKIPRLVYREMFEHLKKRYRYKRVQHPQ
jgi:hypothetical protein